MLSKTKITDQAVFCKNILDKIFENIYLMDVRDEHFCLKFPSAASNVKSDIVYLRRELNSLRELIEGKR